MTVSAPDAFDRVRERIGRGLGASLVPRADDPPAKPLDGDWLGGFAQARAFPMNHVTAASARLASLGQSTMLDEYGEATLEVVSVRGERVEVRKTYASSGNTFVYVGRHRAGTWIGYWHSPRQPLWRGAFAFVRADRLTSLDESAVRARVRSTSPRANAHRFLLGALVVTFGAAMYLRAFWLACVAIALYAAWGLGLRLSLAELGRDADRCKRALD